MVRGGLDGQGGRQGVSGAGIAVAVVVMLAVTALVLRPDHGLLHSGKGPLGRFGVVAIALCLAWAVGLMRAAQHLRARITAERTALGPVEERLRQAVFALLLVGPAALGVLALVLHRFTHRKTSATVPPATPSEQPTQLPPLPPPADHDAQHGSSALPLYLLLGLVLACALGWAVFVLVRRLRLRGLTVPSLGPAPPGTDADDRELLLSAVESGRRALDDGGDARAAVIACYAAMEEALAVSGVDRRASDSPADLLLRAARAGLADGPAAPRLTALFREARYSSHPMDDTQRAAAATALEEIATRLQEREGVR
ncbi:DUF4129 domain-containing protein [Streptomyces sp. SID14478]|uniref:DUF4129 domain-containing protein n=1 Tax=Streptomyces sp. SID14478 TaxID=2706073 RepID=UPI0013D9BEF9|nr:DUF4129 domain-containing protein [Streptomyces sp. SID14478]NEB74578.1 DUF4129 domain-containing protein [Streptomyces sp. SID14478]